MSDDELDELWRRLARERKARWMPGMRYVTDSWRAEGFDRVPERTGTVAYADWLTPGRIPDLTDPATLGCVPALVREAWELPVAVWYPKDGGSCVGVGRMPIRPGRIWTRASLAEALVAALEVAP